MKYLKTHFVLKTTDFVRILKFKKIYIKNPSAMMLLKNDIVWPTVR